jgi:hypothetical protein
MAVILKSPITGPAAWRGADVGTASAWTHHLTPTQIALMDQALDTLATSGHRYPSFSKEHFPIEPLGPLLAQWAETLENGRGFHVVRGLPVERYTEEQIKCVTYGIGLHLGQPVSQNPRGDLLGEVMNVGDLNDKHTRVYQTNLYLPYHSDPSDVVGLMCVHKAKAGGLSSLVSVASIYNRMLAEAPEYLGLFYRSWYYAHMGEPLPSLTPLLSYFQGKLSCRYLRQYIELGHEIRGLPLSPVELAALDAFDAFMMDPSMRVDMMLEPGDLQFANNYMVLHSRNAFVDDEDPAQRRKMLRLWLKMPNARALAPEFPGRNGFPAVTNG